MKKKETYLAIGEEHHKRACISLGVCVLIEEVLAAGTNDGDEVRRQGRETERVGPVFFSLMIGPCFFMLRGGGSRQVAGEPRKRGSVRFWRQEIFHEVEALFVFPMETL